MFSVKVKFLCDLQNGFLECPWPNLNLWTRRLLQLHSLLSPSYFQKMSSGQKTSWTETGGNEGKVESATAAAPVCPTGIFTQSTLLFCFLLPNLSCLALWTSIKYRVLGNVVESYSNSLQRNTTTEITTPNISLLIILGNIPMTEI